MIIGADKPLMSMKKSLRFFYQIQMLPMLLTVAILFPLKKSIVKGNIAISIEIKTY